MLNRIFIFILLSFNIIKLSGQNSSTIIVDINEEKNTLFVKQLISYTNTSNHELKAIEFIDWANAFSKKDTPLANRFEEDFRRNFHYSTEDERGYTIIEKLQINNENASYSRAENHPDILKVQLNQKLKPNESVNLSINYTVKIADSKFTGYGYTKEGFKLRYWHLAPSVIQNNEWVNYSHKNINDFIAEYSNYDVTINTKYFTLNSNLEVNQTTEKGDYFEHKLSGKNIKNIQLFIGKEANFQDFEIQNKKLSTNLPSFDLKKNELDSLLNKTLSFSKQFYGEPVSNKILLDYSDYKKQPVYGFTQLPDILSPFEDQFQFEMIALKQITNQLGKNNFKTNLRKDQWITDALQVYILIKYVETYYPDMKLSGRLHKIIGIRWFHGSQIPFNDQYYLGYKNMPARFLNQSLSTPKDSLIKFNYNISNPYKAGMGLNYLNSFLENDQITDELISFFNKNQLENITTEEFLNFIETKSTREAKWFRNDFVKTNQLVDINLSKKRIGKDSIIIKIKNKGKEIPVKLTGLQKDSVTYSKWTSPFKGEKSYTFSKKDFDHFAIDYEEVLPEVNRRNNHLNVGGILNKKIQFKLLQDVEDPKYHQIFCTPQAEYNVYDGLILGNAFSNKSFIRRNLSISFKPEYGFESNKLIGSIGFSYSHQLKEYGWYLLGMGAGASTSSYAEDLSYYQFTPSLSLSYRPKDLRSNLRKSLSLKYRSINREVSPEVELSTPNYNILVGKYGYSNSTLTHRLVFGSEVQQAKDFNKLIGRFNYRKIFNNTHLVNFRLFAGTFTYNNTTEENGDYFSFGLYRPNDYLFEYSYLSRDDNSGLASQQIIQNQGYFKSFVNTRYANQWLVSTNLESSIWNWILAYGDFSYLKNKGESPLFQYDSGIKLNLVQDYFELFFPIQSSLGFEPKMNNYSQKIRFKVTLSVNTLVKLFTREWY